MTSSIITSFAEFFPTGDINSRRENNIPISIPMSRTTFSAQLPTHAFPKIWNSLPYSTLCIHKRHIFKSSIKSQFISNYSNLVTCNNPFCPDCK